jgi:hypothetical protein
LPGCHNGVEFINELYLLFLISRTIYKYQFSTEILRYIMNYTRNREGVSTKFVDY